MNTREELNYRLYVQRDEEFVRTDVRKEFSRYEDIVNGSVENSVLFKKVYIGDGSVVKNCVLLNDVYVGNGVTLENCIVEKKVKIEDGTCVIGDPNDVTVLP